jgi:hypothetical protein
LRVLIEQQLTKREEAKMKRFFIILSAVVVIISFGFVFHPLAQEKKEGEELYTIKQGDTLWDISAKFLKDPFLWPKLWQRNPYITNPHWIYPGQPVRIVPAEELMKEVPKEAVKEPEIKKAEPTPAEGKPPVAEGKPEGEPAEGKPEELKPMEVKPVEEKPLERFGPRDLWVTLIFEELALSLKPEMAKTSCRKAISFIWLSERLTRFWLETSIRSFEPQDWLGILSQVRRLVGSTSSPEIFRSSINKVISTRERSLNRNLRVLWLGICCDPICTINRRS